MTPITAHTAAAASNDRGFPWAPRCPTTDGTDAGEGQLAQREAPGISDDGDDREPDDGQAPHAIEAEKVGCRDGGSEEHGGDDGPCAEEAGATPCGSVGEFSAPKLAVPAQARLGQDQEGNEEDDCRHCVLEPLDVGVLGQIGHRVRNGEAQDDRTHEGHRNGAQTPDDRRRVGIDDEERQRGGGQGQGGCDEDPRQCGQYGSDDPGIAGVGNGARPVERGERPVVDAGPHGDAHPGAVEEQPQADGDDEGQDQHGHVVVGDPDRPEDQGVVVEEGGQRPIRRGVPDPLGDTQEHERDGQRDDELGCLRNTFEPAHHPRFDNDADHGRNHEETHEHRHEGRPAPADAQLPVGEGTDHADGAMGPIEYPGRRVGESEAARRYRVDARRSQAADGEDDELMHVRPPTALFVV